MGPRIRLVVEGPLGAVYPSVMRKKTITRGAKGSPGCEEVEWLSGSFAGPA